MFLEETLEALEMEEDSGLSNDEPEPGNLVTRMADLTACMSQSNITGVCVVFFWLLIYSNIYIFKVCYSNITGCEFLVLLFFFFLIEG